MLEITKNKVAKISEQKATSRLNQQNPFLRNIRENQGRS
jgi:hypothetical protein